MAIARDGTGSGRQSIAAASSITITFTTNASRHLVITGGYTDGSTGAAVISSITDSGSGSWTVKEHRGTNDALLRAFVAYSENRASVTSVTINFSAAVFCECALDQFSGVATTASFDTQVNADGAVASTSWSSGNLTAGNSNCLIIGAAEGDGGSNSSWSAPGGSWTEIFQFGDTTSNTAVQTIFQVASGSTGPFSLTWNYAGMGASSAGTSLLVSFLPAGGAAPDQIWQEQGDWYEGTTLAEVEGTDLGPWSWYADDVTPSRAGTEQIAFVRVPEAFEWEDPNALDEVFYQWPWAQGPPPADIDTQVYPQSIEDGALQPVEFIDEDFAFFDAPRPADVVTIPDQVVPEDGSLQPVEIIDEDFAFFDAPRPNDVPPDLGGIECSDEQLEDVDEDFGFSAAPFEVPVSDLPYVEDSSEQLEDVDEDFGFTQAPTPEDIYDQLFNEFGGFEDPADEDGEDFFDSPRPDDVVTLVDPIYGEDSSDQLEDQDEDFGFAVAPQADDNDIAASWAYDADEQQEEDEFAEGFADAPLSVDLVVAQDQIGYEDSSDQLEDADEDFGFVDAPLSEDAPMLAIVEDGNTREEDIGEEDFGTQSLAPLPDDIQSDQVFVSFPDQSEEPEDEAYGFSTDPTVPELVIEEPLPVCDFPLQSEEPPDEDFGFSDLQTPDDVIVTETPLVGGGYDDKKKHRWLVQVGKRVFEVDSVEEARALMDRLDAQAPEAAKEAVQAQTKKPRARIVSAPAPVAQAKRRSDDIGLVTQLLLKRIAEYNATLEAVMRLAQELDDEEAIFLLL